MGCGLPPITKKSVTSALSLGRLLHFDHRNLETVRISITTYIAKRKIVHRTKLTVFQNHFTASGSPVDFILPNFSLLPPFNRVNLWYFSIFFVFTFLTHTLCLKSHAWLVLSLCKAPIGLERGKHLVHPTVTVNLLLKRANRSAAAAQN